MNKKNQKATAEKMAEMFAKLEPRDIVAFSNRISEAAELLGGPYAGAMNDFSMAIAVIALKRTAAKAEGK